MLVAEFLGIEKVIAPRCYLSILSEAMQPKLKSNASLKEKYRVKLPPPDLSIV